MASPLASVHSLPDNILLQIFQHLPVRDLCNVGSICKQWKRISNDRSLWRHVNLQPYQLNLHKMWKVLRAHFSDALLSVKIRGYLNSKSSAKWKQCCLSNAMLEDLKERCPNICELHLHSTNAQHLDSLKLPSSLIVLSIQHCLWTPRWLRNNSCVLPCLKVLDVSNTNRVDNFDVEDFIELKSLEELKLNYCYRIQDAGLRKLCSHPTKLRILEISGTKCTDVLIYDIANSMSKLAELKLRDCSQISCNSLEGLVIKVKSLKTLDITDCKLERHEITFLQKCRKDLLILSSVNT